MCGFSIYMMYRYTMLNVLQVKIFFQTKVFFSIFTKFYNQPEANRIMIPEKKNNIGIGTILWYRGLNHSTIYSE